MITHINASEPNWTGKLADTLEQFGIEDIIVVSDDNMLELAINAAERMGKYPMGRIMTEQTYREINTL